MTLSSGIEKRFKAAFVLDGDNLRRLEGVMLKAQSTYSEDLSITYHVEREDDRFYETHDIDDVLADPNIAGRSIRLLIVELRKVSSLALPLAPDDGPVARIVFDKDRPPFQTPKVLLRVSSPQMTWALMLADDIEPHLIRTFRAKAFPKWIFFLFVPLIGLGVYRAGKLLGFDSAIDFGIFSSVLFATLGLAISTTSYLWNTKLQTSSFLNATPVFLWGDELTAFRERESLRKNVFWVVLVGFFVSLVAGIVTLLV